MTTLRAFHNNPHIQAFYSTRVQAHRVAGEIRHGYFWMDGKGCAVGCTVHGSNDYGAYERELGIPRILARLEDGLFEGLPSPEDTLFPEQFLAAPRVGADLSMVWPQFAMQLLSDPEHGVVRYVRPHDDTTRQVIQAIVSLYRQWVDTGRKPAATHYTYAAYGAAAATHAAYAAYGAAVRREAAAAYAAYAAAYAATAAAYAEAATTTNTAASWSHAAAAYAAYAADAADAAAGRRTARLWQAQTLLGLLREAPVVCEEAPNG